MICCVIGGALMGLASAYLARMPLLGGFITRRQQQANDPSTWRLDAGNEGQA